MVVEDSRTVRRIARNILEANGFVVDEAENGAAALEMCREAMPDMVLLDWNMPVMNGIDFLKTIRRERTGSVPPVVFCTSETDLSYVRAALDEGASEYIMKPYNEEILVGKLRQVGLL